MAVLEAFVYDPLMNWLITRKDRTKAKVHDAAFDDLYRGVGAAAVGGGAGGGQARRNSRVDGVLSAVACRMGSQGRHGEAIEQVGVLVDCE